jgi:hypothetical protein
MRAPSPVYKAQRGRVAFACPPSRPLSLLRPVYRTGQSRRRRFDEAQRGVRRPIISGRFCRTHLWPRLAGLVLSLRPISRSSQRSRSITSWRNCEFSSSSSAILSPSLSVRSAISLCSFPCVANFVATSILECLFLCISVPSSGVHQKREPGRTSLRVWIEGKFCHSGFCATLMASTIARSELMEKKTQTQRAGSSRG